LGKKNRKTRLLMLKELAPIVTTEKNCFHRLANTFFKIKLAISLLLLLYLHL